MLEINLFRSSPDQLDLAEGEVVFEAGSPAAHFYGVLAGRIEITIDDKVVDVVMPGGVFGEVGLLGGQLRTGTARALEPSRVARIDEAEFLRLVKMNAYFALRLLRIMAARLENSSSS